MPTPRPIALSDAQMNAIFAASHPLPPRSRSAFLTDVAVALSRRPEVGDGVVPRVIMDVQRRHFDPPYLDGRMPRISKWDR